MIFDEPDDLDNELLDISFIKPRNKKYYECSAIYVAVDFGIIPTTLITFKYNQPDNVNIHQEIK